MVHRFSSANSINWTDPRTIFSAAVYEDSTAALYMVQLYLGKFPVVYTYILWFFDILFFFSLLYFHYIFLSHVLFHIIIFVLFFEF